jgi:hypothetical protein
MTAMELGFEWAGQHGVITVDCRTNHEPDELGCLPGADGLPTCTAIVQFPHLGYRAMFGWVQLVRSTDNATGGAKFEADPFVLFGDTPTPYCWYGLNPTLFDAPSRSTRDDLEWEAHSFLATTPLDEVMTTQTRRIVPLVGFSWGFTIVDSQVAIRPAEQLPLSKWSEHVPTLRSHYGLWTFADA